MKKLVVAQGVLYLGECLNDGECLWMNTSFTQAEFHAYVKRSDNAFSVSEVVGEHDANVPSKVGAFGIDCIPLGHRAATTSLTDYWPNTDRA